MSNDLITKSNLTIVEMEGKIDATKIHIVTSHYPVFSGVCVAR